MRFKYTLRLSPYNLGFAFDTAHFCIFHLRNLARIALSAPALSTEASQARDYVEGCIIRHAQCLLHSRFVITTHWTTDTRRRHVVTTTAKLTLKCYLLLCLLAAEYCDRHVCLLSCLSVCDSISATCLSFTKFSVPVASVCGSVLIGIVAICYVCYDFEDMTCFLWWALWRGQCEYGLSMISTTALYYLRITICGPGRLIGLCVCVFVCSEK